MCIRNWHILLGNEEICKHLRNWNVSAFNVVEVHVTFSFSPFFSCLIFFNWYIVVDTQSFCLWCAVDESERESQTVCNLLWARSTYISILWDYQLPNQILDKYSFNIIYKSYFKVSDNQVLAPRVLTLNGKIRHLRP